MNLRYGGTSLVVRLTLLFAAVSTSVLLLLGLLVASLVEQHFEELDTELLAGKLELLEHAVARVHSAEQLEALPRQLEESLVGLRGMAVLVRHPDGRVLFATPDRMFPEFLLKAARQPVQARAPEGSPAGASAHREHLPVAPSGPASSWQPVIWADAQGRRYRGIATLAPLSMSDSGPALVAVSTEMMHHEHFMRSFNLAMWSVVALAALLSGVLGWGVARRGLAPLRDISRAAARITASQLDQRIAVESIPPELAEVAATLNDMLARLQESFRRLSDFSSDLAHELRTPVSNLLTQTQVTLSKVRTTGEYQDVLASNAEEFERLSRTIADMLFLAKAEHDLIVPHREPVDLAAEMAGLCEFYEALAEEKNLALSHAGRGVVSGDRLMLRRAIGNLLSNAVRHAPDGGVVALRVEETPPDQVRLSVENTGETIAAEHLPRLFDRFYRVDASRRNFGEGAGLGLAITRSIVRAHGGTINVRSEKGISRFEIVLPAGRQDPA